jgi:hypothetical protein
MKSFAASYIYYYSDAAQQMLQRQGHYLGLIDFQGKCNTPESLEIPEKPEHDKLLLCKTSG